jgi:hypothetical protein
MRRGAPRGRPRTGRGEPCPYGYNDEGLSLRVETLSFDEAADFNPQE